MIKLNLKYLLCAIVLFITEILIAAYMHDAFIRPTFGDFLVVILMYCGLRSFIQANFRIVALVVLFLAYTIELSQYFHLIVQLGMEHSKLAQWILGSGFSWGDMLAYTMGVILIWLVESRRLSGT